MKPKNLVVISSYPPRGETHNKKIVGVASYTKNLLLSFAKRGKVNINVLAENLPNEEKFYKEDKINVHRVWKRDSFLIFPTLLKEIIFKKDAKILFEFEHAMFGSPIFCLPLPFFLLFLKVLLRRDVTFVFHQVISDINDLSGHINLNKNGVKAIFLNAFISIFYRSLLLSITNAVVFEDELKLRLKRFGNEKKIEVIPHGIEEFEEVLNQEKAREKLKIDKNKFVILNFGFLAWYKGSDLIINLFKSLPKEKRNKIKLILAGGPNPNHVGKKYYDLYIKKIETDAKKNGVEVTGFVPEEKIPAYFRAADLVVFPYRTFMSSSGPLSMALSFKAPFIVSEQLSGLLNSKDFKKALELSKLSPDDLIFKLTSESFTSKIEVLMEGKLQEKMRKMSKTLEKERKFDKIAESYEKIIFQNDGVKTYSSSALPEISLGNA